MSYLIFIIALIKKEGGAELMNLYYKVQSLKGKIPRNTYKTILGQIKAGDVKGAETGIKRIKEKLKGEKL